MCVIWREVLRSARTYYVNASTGSDTTKDGLTSGNPFATVARAWDVVCKTLDLASQSVVIQLADATYTTPIVLQGQPQGLGSASVTIQGTTAGGAVISTTSDNAVTVTAGASITVKNIKFQTTTSGTGLKVYSKSSCAIDSGCQFGACATSQIDCTAGSQLINIAGYTINGNAPIHFSCSNVSLISMFAGTIDASNRAFSNVFAAVSENSVISIGVTFTTTSSTGTRYFISSGALIQTFGAGATYLPGNAGGFADAGQYL